ncbi:hypothetical protein CHS0354_004291 [Potamilus streckersoni]|uniref:Uncharacterized protein n=1 Tax=Potamilus streckersoni TaxID=2493646 RepID=A0AAE0S531_9BIVA|nr:hypothetical protein CHS0354_004291 [Potamilus streckersoni]
MDTKHEHMMPTNSETIGLPSAGKSSLINSLATLIHGKHLPVASVGQGVQQTHTYGKPRYSHFGLTEDHLQVSPNAETARIIHPYLPNLDDFIGLSDQNTPEIKEVLSLKMFGYLKPGIQATALFKTQTDYGVGSLRSWYTQPREEWKTDVIIFVHNVAVTTIPKALIACVLEVMKPKDTLRPVEIDLFVVLTNFDKVKRDEVSKDTLEFVENDIANSFGFHGFKGYKLFKVANWCDSVGIPNSSADNRFEWDETGVYLNNQLLKLLRSMSIPKAEHEPIDELTRLQQLWFQIYKFLRVMAVWVRVHLDAYENISMILFGVFIVFVVCVLLLR